MNAPVGLLGVTQFEALTNQTPARMKTTMITSLMATITLFALADSLIPTTSRMVIKMMINIED